MRYPYSINQAAIIGLFRVINRYVGNLPPMPGVFPDYPAHVVRNVGAEREMVLMRWRMPPPPRTGAMVNTDMSNGNMRGACTHYMIAQRIQNDVRDPFGNLHFE